MYLARLFTSNLNPLLHESFQLTKTLDSSGSYSWFTFAKDILSESNIDIDRLKTCDNLKQLKNIKSYIKPQINSYYNNLLMDKLKSIDDKSKLNFYKGLEPNLLIKPYLSNPNFEFRKLITKLRISDHSLLIEKGRHFKIPREERLCKKCKVLDDEKHFLINCSHNSNIRLTYFNCINRESNSFANLTDNDKVIYILNPSTPTQVNKLGSFIKKVNGTEDRGPFNIYLNLCIYIELLSYCLYLFLLLLYVTNCIVYMAIKL